MVATERVRLSDEQQMAVSQLLDGIRNKNVFQTLGGFAGTGKTTIIRTLVDQLPNFAVCAYTGKAAQVLRHKGVEATTIHSLIYQVVLDTRPVQFVLRDELEGIDGIIIDEASMVGRTIYDDLVSFGLPLVFVGDHGQLEPVGGDDFNLMARPQITLETIHRNAGEIARFAEHLRRGGEAIDWRENGGQVAVIDQRQLSDSDDITAADQVLCAYNRTRVALNQTIRQGLGFGDQPEVNDRVICLQNDKTLGVFNGMQGTITKLGPYSLTFDCGGWTTVEDVPYMAAAFNSEKKPEYVRGRIPFDYGYCLSGHKSQGSEWDNVLVMEQRCSKWSMQRWNYTVASRAKKKLTWVAA